MALSATMRFATDPRSVKFPATVEAHARRSQASAASEGRAEMEGANISVRGTLDTVLLPTRTRTVKTKTPPNVRMDTVADTESHTAWGKPVALNPATVTKRPEKNKRS